MPFLFYDHIKLKERNLLIPRRKPSGHIKVDNKNHFFEGLEYLQLFRWLYDTNQANGNRPNIVDFTHSNTDMGGAMSSTGSTTDHYDTNYDKSWSTENNMSFFILYRSTGASGTIAAQRDASNVAWQIYHDTTQLTFRIGNTWASINNTMSGINDGEWHAIGISVDFGSNVTGYLDGNVMTQGVTTLTVSPSGNNIDISIGHRWQVQPTAAFTLVGDFVFFSLWRDRLFNAEDHYDLYHDPYQMLIPI